MCVVRKLGNSVQERTTSVGGLLDLSGHPDEQGVEQRTRIVAVLLDGRVPPHPEQAVAFGHKGFEQRVLAVEGPVKAGLRHTGFGDYGVDADRTDPLLIKEPARRREDALARGRLSLAGSPSTRTDTQRGRSCVVNHIGNDTELSLCLTKADRSVSIGGNHAHDGGKAVQRVSGARTGRGTQAPGERRKRRCSWAGGRRDTTGAQDRGGRLSAGEIAAGAGQ